MQSFNITTDRELISCLHYLQEEAVMPFVVEVRKPTTDRTIPQNKLMWRRHKEIGDHLGYMPDEIHQMAKEKCVISILMRDSTSYNEMAQAVKAVQAAGMVEEAAALRKEIISMTSTTVLSVKQMAEVLEWQEHFAAEHGAEITFPEDLVMAAYGKREGAKKLEKWGMHEKASEGAL